MKKGWIARVLAAMLSTLALVGCASCGDSDKKDLTVYAPDGAPALALAGLMQEDTEEDGVEYRIVSPDLIASKVTNKDQSKNADLCVLPVTAASKLLGDGARYQMLGVVTHGNLYLLAKESESWAGMDKLVGKTVGVLQMTAVPGLTFKTVLKKAGLAYNEITNEGGMVENAVSLKAISGANAVGTVAADCFLLAEPAATLQKKKGYVIVEDIQALYGGEKGYPQAVLVAKKSLVESRGEWVADFVQKLVESGDWLKTASGEELVSLVLAHMEDENVATGLKADALTADVVGRCGIYFTYADECEGEVEGFLKDLLSVNNKAAAIPSAAFYWQRGETR